MRLLLALVAFTAVSIPAVEAYAQAEGEERDRTTERVERAEADYEQAVDFARGELIEALNEAVYRAADQGDLEELETLEAQRTAFEEEGELPASREVRREALAYHRALERAADDLERTYERAIRDYTRERRIDEARALRTKIAMLRLGATITKVDYEGHTYAMITVPANWDDARAFCLAIGGDLVKLDDRAEAVFVAELAEAAGFSQVWLSASDAAQEGQWFWADGSPCLYHAWRPREPNGGREENYAELRVDTQSWNDVPGTILRAYVCEWPGEPEEDTTD